MVDLVVICLKNCCLMKLVVFFRIINLVGCRFLFGLFICVNVGDKDVRSVREMIVEILNFIKVVFVYGLLLDGMVGFEWKML